MFTCNYLTKKLRKLYLNYTWFSMVAMNGKAVIEDSDNTMETIRRINF